jgi:hypothetical protein
MPPVDEPIFSPYIARIRPGLETALHEDLFSKFSAVPAQSRPWYGVGLGLAGSPPAGKSLGVLIVPPTHIVIAHVVDLPQVSNGVVHGTPSAKEWWIETNDKKTLKIGAESTTPFEQAKDSLHSLLPELDRFLHSKKVRNPYVQLVLAFPDSWNLAGIQDIPIGPHNRGPITIVKVCEVAQAVLSAAQDQKLDASIFREWIKTLLPAEDDGIFSGTWMDPSPQLRRGPRSEQPPVVPPAIETTPEPQEVITLRHQDEWSFDERSARGPTEFATEAITLPQKDDTLFDQEEEAPLRKRRRPVRKLAVAGGAALVILLVALAGYEIAMYFKPQFPLTPYWQQTPEQQPTETPPLEVPPVAGSPTAEPSPSSARSTAPATDARTPPEAPLSPSPEEKTLPQSDPRRPPSPAPNEITSHFPSSGGGTPDQPLPEKPAPPGTYETIRPTAALTQPRESAPVVDKIQSRTKLKVVGSEGNWLIVQSRTRNATVYVRRDDAMMISDPTMQPKSLERAERRWKEIELKIREAILKKGVPNITVTFIGDTAYLRGTVQNTQQSDAAELAAKTIPEVRYVHNGIWISR